MESAERRIKKRRDVLWPVVLAAVITWESVTSVPSVGPAWLSFDKLAHFFVFGLLATTIARLDRTKQWPLIGALWAIVLVSVYGFGDELLQGFTPNRSMEFSDWVADTLGAAVAVVVYLRWTSYRRLLERPFHRRCQPGFLSDPGNSHAWGGDAPVAGEDPSRSRDEGVASPSGPGLQSGGAPRQPRVEILPEAVPNLRK
jgi:VanZ family protein